MLGEVERAGGESKRERRVWIKRQWMKNQDFHAKMKQEEACVDEMTDFLFMCLSVLS